MEDRIRELETKLNDRIDGDIALVNRYRKVAGTSGVFVFPDDVAEIILFLEFKNETARAAALEEAAKLADSRYSEMQEPEILSFAQEIRDLKGKEPST